MQGRIHSIIKCDQEFAKFFNFVVQRCISDDICLFYACDVNFRWTTHQTYVVSVVLQFFGEVEGGEVGFVLATTTDPNEDVRRFGIASLRKCTMKYWLCFGSPR